MTDIYKENYIGTQRRSPSPLNADTRQTFNSPDSHSPLIRKGHLDDEPDIREISPSNLPRRDLEFDWPRMNREVTNTDVPETPRLQHAPLPGRTDISAKGSAAGGILDQSYKPRIRKPKTKELAPENSQPLTSLGMSPFMPAQDAMYNQNRLVRNEAIVAQHLSRIQRSHTISESNHAQRTQDIYHILSDHKASIDNMRTTSGANFSVRSDTEFVALIEEHRETRKSLDSLINDVSIFSASTRKTIDDLTGTVQRLTSKAPTTTAASSRDPATEILPNYNISRVEESASNSVVWALPPITSLKRKRTDSISSSRFNMTSTLKPQPNIAQGVYLPRSDLILQNDASREVLYGPIKDEGEMMNVNAVVDDAVRSVGLSPSMVQSVRPVQGRPEHFNIRFLKADYAYRFVDLVTFGLDEHSERQAIFVNGHPEENEDYASSSAPQRPKSKIKTW